VPKQHKKFNSFLFNKCLQLLILVLILYLVVAYLTWPVVILFWTFNPLLCFVSDKSWQIWPTLRLGVGPVAIRQILPWLAAHVQVRLTGICFFPATVHDAAEPVRRAPQLRQPFAAHPPERQHHNNNSANVVEVLFCKKVPVLVHLMFNLLFWPLFRSQSSQAATSYWTVAHGICSR
jgi:hypothetical protein